MTDSPAIDTDQPPRVDVFSRIVCGLDGSEVATLALAQARRLGMPESRIIAVSVSETRLAVHAGMLAPQVAAEIESSARAVLDDAQAFGVETRLVRGRPDDALLEVVAAENATLIAVGSHETSRGLGMIIGSVATRVVHDAPCSVLMTRVTSEPHSFPRSIVAGVDGSSYSLAAAAVAIEVGARVGAEVTILAASASKIDLDQDALDRCGLTVDRREGKPVAALVEASQNVDLLVVGSRGLRGLRALGSVSERVAHHARCSLLVVRSPG